MKTPRIRAELVIRVGVPPQRETVTLGLTLKELRDLTAGGDKAHAKLAGVVALVDHMLATRSAEVPA